MAMYICLLCTSISNKFICKYKYIFSAGLGLNPEINPHQPKKMGWVELLKTHRITQPGLGYGGLGWVQPDPFFLSYSLKTTILPRHHVSGGELIATHD
jgi:hypothetical protein